MLRAKRHAGIPAAPNPADMSQSQAWAKRSFPAPPIFPSLLCWMANPYTASRPRGARKCPDAVIDNTRVETDFEGTDPKTGLHVRVECTEYQRFSGDGMGGMV